MLCGNCLREIADNSNYCYICGARQSLPPRPAAYPRRLTRSVTDSKLAGVCGGLAEYWQVDSTVIRLVWVLLAIFPIPFAAVVAYIVAWIVMPRADVPVQVVAAPPAHATAAPDTPAH
jgi:phage shock protein C